ncbi:MAG: hypothetical protein ABN480_13945 [Dickeya sp.]
MFNIDYFKKNIAPKMKGYTFKYSYYTNGDFGDLERVEFEGKNRIGGMDFWSKGWLDVDIYDMAVDDQIMNVLLSPEEIELQKKAVCEFMRVLSDEA